MPGWHSSLWKEELKGTLCSGCAREPADVLWTVSCMKEHTDLSTPVLLYVFWFLCAFLSSPLSPKYKTSLETILMLFSLPSNGMENERRTDGDDLKEDITLFTSENNWLHFFFYRVQPLYTGVRCTKGKWETYFSFFLEGGVEYLLLLGQMTNGMDFNNLLFNLFSMTAFRGNCLENLVHHFFSFAIVSSCLFLLSSRLF